MLQLLLTSFKEWVMDRSGNVAASLAYFSVLTLAPLIGFIIFISNKTFGTEFTQNAVIPLLKKWFTTQFVTVITAIFSSTAKIELTEINNLTILGGSLALLWATKEYFALIGDTVEETWNLKRDKYGIKAFFKRTYDDIKTAVISLIIMTSFLFTGAIIFPSEPAPQNGIVLISVLELFYQFAFLFTIFFYYFCFLPPVKVKLANAIPGALLATILFTSGRIAMRSHMLNSPDLYPAEAFIAVILWFYYSNLILTFCSEFNTTYICKKQKIDLQSLKF